MFTAEMVKQELKDTEVCPGIDEWIESYLLPKFKLGDSVNVYDSLFDHDGYRWSREISWVV